MVKNDKYFIAPQKNADNFKVLFARLAAEGAGRPVDRRGFPDGPWTPATLADAISGIDDNRGDIDLRTVQVWFQNNDNGISSANIRWLARIFGCNDPEATSRWQAELRAANDRLARERRAKRENTASTAPQNPNGGDALTSVQDSLSEPSSRANTEVDPIGCDDPEATSDWQKELTAAEQRLAQQRRKGAGDNRNQNDAFHGKETTAEASACAEPLVLTARPARLENQRRTFNLACQSEAFFGRRSPLDLPASVFAGAVALGFLAFFLGIHSIDYARPGGVTKQVGFLWAPNWTFLFMIFMPLYFAFVVEMLSYWKTQGRAALLDAGDQTENEDGWLRKVLATSYTYWAVFILCVGFAGLFQWMGVRLMTLLNGVGDYPVDWGTIALIRPEKISTPQSIAFTGLAYFYMCLCYYLFFVGLILLFTVSHDFWEIEASPARKSEPGSQSCSAAISRRVMRAICRCTVAGIWVAICMKVQSFYLTSTAPNLIEWITSDALSAVAVQDHAESRDDFSLPTHYTSLIVALATCVPFLYGSMRMSLGSRFTVQSLRMALVILYLLASYLLIDVFVGFSIMLTIAFLLSVCSFFDPELRFGQTRHIGERPNVT